MGDITIRLGRAEEIEAIFDVHQHSVASLCAGDYTPTQIENWLAGRTPAMYVGGIEEGRLWVAERDGIVGFVEIAEAEITKLFVRGDRAAAGVGRRLMETAIEALRASGARSIHLEATRTARRFYEKLGFVAAGRGEFACGGTGVILEVIEMRLELG